METARKGGVAKVRLLRLQLKQCRLRFAVGELDNRSESDISAHIIQLVSEKSGVLN